MAKELRAQSRRLIKHTARRPSEEKPVVNGEGEMITLARGGEGKPN